MLTSIMITRRMILMIVMKKGSINALSFSLDDLHLFSAFVCLRFGFAFCFFLAERVLSFWSFGNFRLVFLALTAALFF